MPKRAERGPAALSPLRTVALAIGFGCALAASVTLFITDDAKFLRIAILVALWGFVLAALAAGRRQTEQAMVASTEIELRTGYELELEREVAARREYELRLEAQLRRELQEDFASQVGDLKEEMIRLRRELSEQWDSELRVERMVMRTQSVRMGNDRREALEHNPSGQASIEALGLDAAPSPSYATYSEPAQPAWDGVQHTAAVGPAQDRRPMSEYDDGPGTRELPAVTADVPPPPRPVPPPPPPPPPTPQESPTANPAVAPVARNNDGSPAREPESDVLARVLAEAGAGSAGRRRRHRYADEDDDIPASR